MGVDVGKDAKRKGSTRPRDARKVDQVPMKVAPHKKERKYTLTVEWTDTRTFRRTRTFTTRAALEESQRRIERHFREKAAENEKPKRRSYFWMDRGSPFSEYGDEELTKLKTPPTYTVSQDE